MTYDEIYSRFYLKETDHSLFKLASNSIKYNKKCFSKLTFDDEVNELTFELSESIDKYSDKDFVIEVFAQGMVICWMRPQVEKNVNLATVIGGKEEKTMLNNYKTNVERLKTLENELKKFIRDYGYLNNSYIGES